MRLASLSQLTLLLLIVETAGCASASPAAGPATPQPAPSKPGIGGRCPLGPGPASNGRIASPRIFVEIAAVTGDLEAALNGSQAGTFSEALKDPRLTIPSVNRLLAANDVPTTISIALAQKSAGPQDGASDRRNLTVTAHVDPTNVVRLEIALIREQLAGTPVSEDQRMTTTMPVENQQPIVLGDFATQSSVGVSRLILIPYFIWSDAGLDRLLECKGDEARPILKTPKASAAHVKAKGSDGDQSSSGSR